METPKSVQSPGMMRSRVRELESEVEEMQNKLIQAGMYGKNLMEDNADLRTHIDDLMKQHALQLEEKEQEICSLRSRLDVATSTEKWQQDELSTLRGELQSAKEACEEEKRKETAVHKKQIEQLRGELEGLQSTVQSLRSQNKDLEDLLASHLDRTQTHNVSASFVSASEELAALSEELASLKMELTEAQAKTIEVGGHLQECQREKDGLSTRLRSAQEEIEDLQCQTLSYVRHLEEARRESQELRAELEASSVDKQTHSAKGNSIFSELEDRRVTVEKMMSALRIQNDQLRDKYQMEKQQNAKHKKQLAAALSMSGRQDDATIQRLRQQLVEAHEEIRTLVENMQKLEDGAKGELSSGQGGQLGGDEFLVVTLQIEKDKASKAQNELYAKELQCLDIRKRNIELSQHITQLEADKNKLKSQNLTLLADKEELLAKYEPEKVKAKQPKRVVEKIDLGDTNTSFSTGQQPSFLFPPTVGGGRPSSVFKPSSVTASASTRRGGERMSEVFRANPIHLHKAGTDALRTRNSSLSRPGQRSDFASRLRKDSDLKMSSRSKMKPADDSGDDDGGDSTVQSHDPKFSSSQKENVFDPAMTQSQLFPATRSVKMSDEVEVIYADGDNSITTLAEDKSGAPLESSSARAAGDKKKPKERKTVRNVMKGDAGPEIECKTQ